MKTAVVILLALNAATASDRALAEKNAFSPMSAQSALPSGSSVTFRQRMTGWDEAPASATVRIRNRSEARAGVKLARLTISSAFGVRVDPIKGVTRHHDGIDLPAHFGSRVMATGPGVVRIAGWVRGYGNLVEIAHADGVSTRYGHLSRIDVNVGTQVEHGQILGRVGSTGRSTGPHLHYEVREHGVAVQPLRFAGRISERAEMPDTVWGATVAAKPRWEGWNEERNLAALPASQIR